VDRGEVASRQLDGERADVLFEVLAARRTGNRYDVLPLGEHPRERELGRRTALLRRERFDPTHDVEVSLKVLSLEARIEATEVVFREIFETFDLTGEKPASERTVRHEADAELAARR